MSILNTVSKFNLGKTHLKEFEKFKLKFLFCSFRELNLNLGQMAYNLKKTQ